MENTSEKNNAGGKSKAILALDIGGTHVRAGFVGLDFSLSGYSSENTPGLFGGDPVGGLVAHIKKLIADSPRQIEVTAVSAGFPASIDKSRRTVLSTPNIKGLNNIPIVDILERELKIPAVLGRDVSMLVSFDFFDLKLPDKGVVVGCYFGTGLGNCILIDGKIHYGKNGVAAELGHIPDRTGTAVCGCGNVGCVEAFCAGLHLVALAERLNVSVSEFFTRAGNPFIEEYIDGMAIPVAAEATILDPDYVVLGGGIMQMDGFPKEMFEAAVRRRTRKPLPAENLEFIYSRPGQENGVIGAGIYAYKELGLI
ncbi:MAG: allose kinase [Defluviitaleaceae bacterium]|nr:allose kinase [Defluviitaleaceae bacterium]